MTHADDDAARKAVQHDQKKLLEVTRLEAWYGEAQALFGIDFSIAAGEAAVLLGRNGAGKSSALKAIIGLEVRRAGKIHFDGIEISNWPTHRIARAGLGFVAEDRRIFSGLTVGENLTVGRLPARPDLEPWDEAQIWQLFPPLEAIRDRRAGHLSGGEQQMLAIARTLMGNPRFLLLDEPSEGLAPVILERIAEAVAKLKARGIGLIVAEQNLEFAGGFAEKAMILETGHLKFHGDIGELDLRPELAERYLAV
ncbi:MAG: ABC transporter ATP-binding protein [Hyphomicrobiaceae bacterium]